MKLFIENWKALTPFQKIGTLVAVFSTIYGMFLFVYDKTKDTKIQIVIFDKKTHLGDNNQSSFGGTSSPYVVPPGAEAAVHLLVYDKKEERFESTNGFPSEVRSILSYYGRNIKKQI